MAAAPFEEHGGTTVPDSTFMLVQKHVAPRPYLPFDKGWCSKGLGSPLTAKSPGPAKATAPANHQSQPAINAAKMLPGYIAVPGEQYATPPTISLRCINGQTEGQLQWQTGKVAALTPCFTNYWVHDPPQRHNVMDMRLQPSQRSTSCYSPEFLTSHAAFTLDPEPERPDSPTSTHSAPASSIRSPARLKRNPFVSNHLELSPPGQHRVEGYNEKAFHRLQGTSRPVSPTASLPARPHTSPVVSSTQMAESRSRAVGQASRWGSKSMGPVCALQRSKAKETELRRRTGSAAAYVNGYMQKSLPPSPMTDMVRSMAHSSFDTQGNQSSSVLTRAVSACRISRSKSMQSREGQAVAVGACPRRDTHYPAPTEAQLRASRILTHDKRKYAL